MTYSKGGSDIPVVSKRSDKVQYSNAKDEIGSDGRLHPTGENSGRAYYKSRETTQSSEGVVRAHLNDESLQAIREIVREEVRECFNTTIEHLKRDQSINIFDSMEYFKS